MPTYRRGTKQWAEGRVAEINHIRFLTGANSDREIGEHQRLIEGLVAGIYPDDPSPVYSADELEAVGQRILDW